MPAVVTVCPDALNNLLSTLTWEENRREENGAGRKRVKSRSLANCFKDADFQG